VFRARTAQNVMILVGLQWFYRILGVLTKVFLARLLFPDDFGIFALATGLIGFVGTIGNFGLDYAIVQKGDRATEADYDVGMTLRLLISAALFLASFAIAGPWAGLFGTPVVAPATRALSIMYLVIPWSFVPATRLTSELRQRSIAIPNLSAQLANAIVSVALAILGYGVWALVYGTMLGQAIAVVGFSAVRRWRFRPSLDGDVARSLLGYARYIVSASFLAFLMTNVDNFSVGYLLGSTPLGFYAVAYGFGSLPAFLLSGPAVSALFPSLAKIQERSDSLRGGYLESFSYAAAIIAPTSIGIAVMAPEIVNILLGPIWAPATLVLLILAFYGLGRALVDFSGSLFAAIGKPRVIAELNLYILIASVILLFPLTLRYGIAGTAVSMTIPVVIVAVVSIFRSARTLQGRPREFYARLWGPLVAAEAMGAAVFGFRFGMYLLLPPRVVIPLLNADVSESTVVLLLGVVFGILVYFALLRAIDPETSGGLWRHVRMAFRRGNG
jgi:O-antigen/teichoic acid export membrane protein